jgi:hypothetical protein
VSITPTSTFITGAGPAQISAGGPPADANVAVGSTHVCVTGRDAFACYTKDGALVSPGPNLSAQPYLVEEFFPAMGTPVPSVPAGSPAKDGRVVFDQHRQRFFMVFQGRQLPPILYIAVSKTENPSDGWWTYADNVLLADPTNGDINGQDYDWIGISGAHLLVTNRMGRNTGTPYTPTWKNVAILPVNFMYDADELASGNKNYTRTEVAIPQGFWAVPCVHDTFTTDAYWVSRDDATHVTVWGVRNGTATPRQVTVQSSTGTQSGPLPGGVSVDYNNIGSWPQNAEYRDGKIVFVSNDGHTWQGQSKPNNAVRLVRLDVSNFYGASNPGVTVEIDRIFGRAAATDPAGEIFDYGWPAVSTNARGDIVIGSIRSNATTLTQFRASVWFAGDSDISSSIPLSSSVAALEEFHMAGAGYDRSTGAVFVAQQVAESAGPYQIRVASILGGQPNWRWCSACQGMYFAGNGAPTTCPMGGTHKFAQSYDYALHGAGTGPAGQDNWRWCNKCQGLSFAGNGPPRKCPMGGNHDLTGSGDYELIQVDPSKPLRPQMQASWRWCNKCQSLYYAGNIAATVCLEGGSHDDTGSGDYALEWIPNPP